MSALQLNSALQMKENVAARREDVEHSRRQVEKLRLELAEAVEQLAKDERRLGEAALAAWMQGVMS